MRKNDDILIETFHFENFLEKKVFQIATELDNSVLLMKSTIADFIAGVRQTTQEQILLLTNTELEALFSASAAFGFTLGQHFAAIERLSESDAWKQKNYDCWKKLSTGKELCGLATTHLGRPGPAILTGIKATGGYQLNGTAPWSCGFGIFDQLVVGFEINDQVVFATTEYPKSLKTDVGVSVKQHELVCLNGTASVLMNFKETFIDEKHVISTRPKSSDIKIRASRYVGFEIGIGKRALSEIQSELQASTHPRKKIISIGTDKIKARLNILERMRAETPQDPMLSVLIFEFNQDCVRLLSLTLGARALLKTSFVSRLQQELSLFDAVVQSPKSIALKIERIVGGFD